MSEGTLSKDCQLCALGEGRYGPQGLFPSDFQLSLTNEEWQQQTPGKEESEGRYYFSYFLLLSLWGYCELTGTMKESHSSLSRFLCSLSSFLSLVAAPSFGVPLPLKKINSAHLPKLNVPLFSAGTPPGTYNPDILTD